MKVYTKTGDRGDTSLLGGARVRKYDLRIESYGTVDELNAYIGLVRDHQEDASLREQLRQIQETLFTIGSHLAKAPGKDKVKLPALPEEQVAELEQAMDAMDEGLPAMRFFVLPGGHPVVSHCHVARCVCRRAERRVIELGDESNLPEFVPQYLNRLSDFLFVLSRKLTHDLQAEEVPWQPRG